MLLPSQEPIPHETPQAPRKEARLQDQGQGPGRAGSARGVRGGVQRSRCVHAEEGTPQQRQRRAKVRPQAREELGNPIRRGGLGAAGDRLVAVPAHRLRQAQRLVLRGSAGRQTCVHLPVPVLFLFRLGCPVLSVAWPRLSLTDFCDRDAVSSMQRKSSTTCARSPASWTRSTSTRRTRT